MHISFVRLLQIAVFALTIASSFAQCPSPLCECHQSAECDNDCKLLYCKDRNLGTVPGWSNTNYDFIKADLRGNRLTTLPANAFKTTNGDGLDTIELDLTDNRITSIDDEAFAGLENSLEILRLEVNSMDNFPTAALSRLTNLKQLYLTDFTISSLPNNALSSLQSLEILSMENCGLNSLSSSDFTSQRSTLVEIHLKANQFNSVPKQALNTLTSLTHLDLSRNRITTIDDNDFSGMNALETLDLASNGVNVIRGNAFNGAEDTLRVLSLHSNGANLVSGDLSPLRVLENLRQLDLSYNGINSIPNRLFESMDQLEMLDIKDNGIQSLHSDNFIGLGSSVRVMNFANNDISSIVQDTFRDLSGLEELSLNSNPLQSEFTQNTFFGLDNLKILRLMQTQFRSADFTSISHLSSLETLNLEENNINSVPNDTFINLNALSSLDLAENSLVTLTQFSLNGLQNSLETIWLTDNQIETLPSCLFYGFDNTVEMHLEGNPLNCDCDAYWLRLKIENMDRTEQYLNEWKCETPDEHNGKFLKDIHLQELCNPPPEPEQCYQSSTTVPTTTTSPGAPTSPGPSSPMVVEIKDVTAHTMKITWEVQSNEDLITRFTLECQESETGHIHTRNEEYGPNARDAKLEDLKSSTQYVVCVTAWIDQYQERTCTDATTMPGSGESKSKFSALQIILGCLLAVFGLLVVIGVIICLVCVYRRKKKRYPPIQKSTTSLNSQVPMVSDHSKRFSKPKPFSVSTDNIVSSIEMERRLEGFTADERDRILRLFSKSGASTLSMMSATSSRYVHDPTGAAGGGYLRGAEGGAYSNHAIPMQDEGQYEELPGDQYNYIPFDEITPDIDEQPNVHPPPLRPESYI